MYVCVRCPTFRMRMRPCGSCPVAPCVCRACYDDDIEDGVCSQALRTRSTSTSGTFPGGRVTRTSTAPVRVCVCVCVSVCVCFCVVEITRGRVALPVSYVAGKLTSPPSVPCPPWRASRCLPHIRHRPFRQHRLVGGRFAPLLSRRMGRRSPCSMDTLGNGLRVTGGGSGGGAGEEGGMEMRR